MDAQGKVPAGAGAAATWWASGDFSVRPGCVVEPLIDGRAALYAMAVAFLSARQYILLAGWDICADLPMVRGGDLRIGDDNPLEHDRFVQVLREQGLDDDAIALWDADHLRVVDVLGFVARRGVKVGVLLWDALHAVSHLTNDPAEQSAALTRVGVDCLLDDSSRRLSHITQSLHQKCCVVDGRVAFVGGIDLTVQEGGDYDRWDVHQHPCTSAERASHLAAATHPWHDVHTRVQGPVVADVLRNIVQRWTTVAARRDAPQWPIELPMDGPAPLAHGVPAQIVRTIPPHTYPWAPDGIATVKDSYLRALGRAECYVYLENQYLWPEVFLGLEAMRWGPPSPDMMELLEAMAQTVARGVHLALVLPDHPNAGRKFTDGGVEWLRQRAAQAGAADRLHVFMLGNARAEDTTPGSVLYRPVYTHAKVAIVDDVWWTAGSANLNSRGMHSDAEINVSALDAETARELRLRLWHEHVRREGAPLPDVDDPLGGLALLDRIAADNQRRVVGRELLAGHLLPYLTEAEGRRQGIPVHGEHGWLDNLPGSAGPQKPEHAGRYL